MTHSHVVTWCICIAALINRMYYVLDQNKNKMTDIQMLPDKNTNPHFLWCMLWCFQLVSSQLYANWKSRDVHVLPIGEG